MSNPRPAGQSILASGKGMGSALPLKARGRGLGGLELVGPTGPLIPQRGG